MRGAILWPYPGLFRCEPAGHAAAGCSDDFWLDDDGLHPRSSNINRARLRSADIVLAYFNEVDCFGTLIEISEMGKPFAVGFGRQITDEQVADVWMAAMPALKIYRGTGRGCLARLCQGLSALQRDLKQRFVATCQRIWPGSVVVRNETATEGNESVKSKYEMKDGDGSLFKNDKKAKETDADYNGSARLDGTDYSINGWKKTAKSGVSYLKLSLRPKGGGTGSKGADFDDAIGL